jgi:methylated-DNA-[protein]-cysteine S-methyltransferase
MLRLVAGETGLCAIGFMDDEIHPPDSDTRDDSHPLLVETAAQLHAYFDGSLRTFSLRLDMAGTDFQLRVWNLLREIPYGETRSYRDLAAALGRPRAVRAVGAANGANPLPIVVPCHRVIGADGRLTGYGGGLPLKKQLLELERTYGEVLLYDTKGLEI